MSTLFECREVPLAAFVAMLPEGVRPGKIRCWSAPSDLGGDLPQAIWLLRDSPNLDWIAPYNGPWSCLPLDWKCFRSLGIHRANFPAVQTKSHMQTKLC